MGRAACTNMLVLLSESSPFPAWRTGGLGVVTDELALVAARLDPRSTRPSLAARVLICVAQGARVNPVFASGSRVVLGRRLLGVAFVHAIERGLLVGQGALAVSRMIAATPLRDRPVRIDDRLAAGDRGGDCRLVLERYGDRRDVGLGPADPFGEGL